MAAKESDERTLLTDDWTTLQTVLAVSLLPQYDSSQARPRLLERIAIAGMRVRGEMPMDGNCFFHACCDQLSRFGDRVNHEELRKKAVDNLKKSPYTPAGDHMKVTVENQDWEAYLAKMSKKGEWADHQVVIAVANVTGRDIWIWSSHNDNPIVVEPSHAERQFEPELELEPILLGHISEVHYESLGPPSYVLRRRQKGDGPPGSRVQDETHTQHRPSSTSNESLEDPGLNSTGTAADETQEQELQTKAEAQENVPELILAVQSKDKERVSQLLRQGSSVHVAGQKTANIWLHQTTAPLREDVYNCIHYAAALGDPNLVKLLVRHGASLNQPSKDWRYSPLMVAAGYGKLDTVKELLSSGAALHLQDRFGASALHYAAKANSEEVVAFLIDKGAPVNGADNDLSTPLHYAARQDHHDVVVMLLDRGANVDLRNRDGKSVSGSGSDQFRIWLQNLLERRKYEVLYSEGTVPLGTVKICFIGSAGAGKTTLMNAMLRRFLSRIFAKENQADEPDRVDERTVGVDFLSIDVPGLGLCLLFDFAGQVQFHKTHGLLFPATKSFFILLVNLMLGEEEMYKRAKYWLRFLRACFPESVKPRVLMAASRGDRCPAGSEERAAFSRIVESLRDLFDDKLIITASSVVLDCRKSGSAAMRQLKKLLDTVRTEIIEVQENYPRLCVPALKLVQSLRKTKDEQFMKTVDLVDAIQESLVTDVDVNYCRQLNKETVDKVFEYFQDTAEILCHGDISVLDVQNLCQFTIGPLLAPENFPHHLTFENKDARVTASEVEKVLKRSLEARKIPPKMDVCTILPLVKHLDLCLQVEGTQDVYLFPAHLHPLNKLSDMWEKEDRMKVYVGRQVRCASRTSIISPGTFSFFQCRAYVSIDTTAALWRDVIILHKSDAQECPVQCLCVMTKHLGEVNFIVRSGAGSQSDCLKFLETVMVLWNQIVKEHSLGTECELRYLSKRHIEEHIENPGAYSEESVKNARSQGPDGLVRLNTKHYNISESWRDLLVTPPVVAILNSKVLRAVQKHGSSRWYALGTALDYSDDELQRITYDKPKFEDKLLAIFNIKAKQVGQVKAEKMLSDACNLIEPPIHHHVAAELRGREQIIDGNQDSKETLL